MPKIAFPEIVGIAGIVLTVVLIVLDKAGKLKGHWLFILLSLAALMTLFIAVGNSWVMDAPERWRIWRGALLFCITAFAYSGIALWIAPVAPIIEAAPIAADLGVFATVSSADYPGTTSVAGAQWSRKFSDMRVMLDNSSGTDFQDVDLSLLPDQPIAGIGQVSNIPDVTFTPTADLSIRQELVKGGTGQRIVNPLILIATEGGYRLRCKALPRRSRLEVIVAIARVIDFSPPGTVPKPKGNVFSRDYILRVGSGTVGHWYGHGLFDELYKSEKVIPHNVKVEGTYNENGKQQGISKDVEVKDIMGEVIKQIKPGAPF